jgi:tyrosine-specific transport protein
MRKMMGASLLLAGTCIGAGMLALPVTTAPSGFLWSLVLLVAAWIFMTYTAHLVIEASLWMPKGTNYVSMARNTLGAGGGIVTWCCFLLLLYALMVAYMTAGGAIVSSAFAWRGIHLTTWESYLPWVSVFAVIIYMGVNLTDVINRILMFGLIVSFALLATFVSPHVKTVNLVAPGHARYMLAALPVLLASFGFHIVLPGMRGYLDGRVRPLRQMIFLGSVIPLLIYVLWEVLIFGVVSRQGAHGLLAILNSGQPTHLLTHTLITISQSQTIGMVARFFAFFAITSSFVGVSLGLFDLLADGFKASDGAIARMFIAALTFVPPFIFALAYPQGFIMALGYAGVFVAVLHGILPAIMVWSGRYVKKDLAKGYRVIGGKFVLALVCVIALLVIYAQVGVNLHWIARV